MLGLFSALEAFISSSAVFPPSVPFTFCAKACTMQVNLLKEAFHAFEPPRPVRASDVYPAAPPGRFRRGCDHHRRQRRLLHRAGYVRSGRGAIRGRARAGRFLRAGGLYRRYSFPGPGKVRGGKRPSPARAVQRGYLCMQEFYRLSVPPEPRPLPHGGVSRYASGDSR